MWETIEAYWPHVLAALSVTLATTAAVHATMTKTEVRSALGWVGVILLSPLVGALIYLGFGINRMQRGKTAPAGRTAPPPLGGAATDAEAEAAEIERDFGPRLAALCHLGRRVSGSPLRAGNRITLLGDGDATYAAMVEAIGEAQHSILLESYIFDHDQVGLRIVSALAEAQTRGVAVRVLIDAVGARYSKPTILRALEDEGIPAALFNGRLITGLRLPYANLRTHRKILVIDDTVALVGGMNIREGFTKEFAGNTSAHDTHFRVEGPAVADYRAIAVEDWTFASGETLEAWAATAGDVAKAPLGSRHPKDALSPPQEKHESPALPLQDAARGPAGGIHPGSATPVGVGAGALITRAAPQVPAVAKTLPKLHPAAAAASTLTLPLSAPLLSTPMVEPAGVGQPADTYDDVRLRVVASGPDARLETAHKLLMGAFSTAERHIRIMSPYFLPDRELISALTTAARRGVDVDIVTPAHSNLTLVDRAMQAQFDQVLKDGCRVWRAEGPFDHSKLLTIDGAWSFVGSSNLDPRSLRLNFEVDGEIFDRGFASRIARRIDSAIATARPVTLEDLRARPFVERLANRALWLGSPYL